MKRIRSLTRNIRPRKSLARTGIFSFILTLGFLASPTFGQTLLLEYTFDQSTGTTAFDSAADPADGVLVGAGSTWTDVGLPGNFKAGNAYSNSGANGTYVSAGYVEKLDGLGDFTFSGWMNVRSAVTDQFLWDRVMSKRSSTGAFFDLRFTDVGDGDVGLALEINTGSGSGTVTSIAMDMSDWFFFAVSRDADSGAISFYYGDASGALSAAGSGSGPTGNIAASGASFFVGNVSANTARAPDADFSDIRIYDGALDISEVQAVQAAAIPEMNRIGLSMGAFASLLLLSHRARRRSV